MGGQGEVLKFKSKTSALMYSSALSHLQTGLCELQQGGPWPNLGGPLLPVSPFPRLEGARFLSNPSRSAGVSSNAFAPNPRCSPSQPGFLDRLESMLVGAKHSLLFRETSPLWAQLLRRPSCHRCPPLPTAQSGDTGAEGALSMPTGSAFHPSRQGDRAEGEGKGRRGHLSISASQD